MGTRIGIIEVGAIGSVVGGLLILVSRGNPDRDTRGRGPRMGRPRRQRALMLTTLLFLVSPAAAASRSR
jgi:hypothetical protein